VYVLLIKFLQYLTNFKEFIVFSQVHIVYVIVLIDDVSNTWVERVLQNVVPDSQKNTKSFDYFKTETDVCNSSAIWYTSHLSSTTDCIFHTVAAFIHYS
jgi:hypothetical protein